MANNPPPGWIAAGLDFPDWVELAAPRPYAIIATASDMFPYAGARSSAAEARRFYALFNPICAGTPTGASEPGIPTTPTLNPDTANTVSPSAPLQFIVGPGGHGNLRPLQEDILRFFMFHLAYSNAAPKLPPPPVPGANPFAPPTGLPAGALQVTSTGQVSTAYPGSATVFSLNLAHFKRIPPPHARLLPLQQFQDMIRKVTGATATPGAADPPHKAVGEPETAHIRHILQLETAPGIMVSAEFYRPTSEGKHPGRLILRNRLNQDRAFDDSVLGEMASFDTAVFVLAPRPSPPGTEEQKSPILGEFYLLGLREELVGRTLLGQRVEDVIRAVDFFSTGSTEDPHNITAEASGHEALVLLHAAVLDPRLKHVTVSNIPSSYRNLIVNSLPKDAAEDILPGVLLHYDIADLIYALGSRVTVVPSDNPAPAP